MIGTVSQRSERCTLLLAQYEQEALVNSPVDRFRFTIQAQTRKSIVLTTCMAATAFAVAAGCGVGYPNFFK